MEQKVIFGDCLQIMPSLPSGSVDLILVDPPYGTVKGIGEGGSIQHGMVGKVGWDSVLDTSDLFKEYNRLLRMNGCLIMFAQEPYTSHLITNANANVPFSYRLIWKKDHFANALTAKVAPLSYYEDILVFFKKYDTLAQHPVRQYADKIMKYTGKNLKTINNELGHRKAEHFFYVESTQFGLCTESVYNEIIARYNLETYDWFIPYTELKELDRRFSRRFNLPEGKKFKSNVLEYKKDYRGEHPTQKPLALIKDLISTYSNEGDTVLDSCLGSGTTLLAAQELGRKGIGIEISEEYCEIARKRLNT